MKKKNGAGGCKNIYYILESLRKKMDVFGYTGFLVSPNYDDLIGEFRPIERFPTGYKTLEEKIKNGKGLERGVYLPLHLERAYEILIKKMSQNKENLNIFRKKLLRSYLRRLQDFADEWIRSEINFNIDNKSKIDIKKINQKAEFYLKKLEFERDTRGEEFEEEAFYIQALRHIQVIAGKINFEDFSEPYRDCDDWDKNILLCLAERWINYCEEDINLSKRELSKRKKIYKNAISEINTLFKS